MLQIKPYEGEPNIDRLIATVRGEPTERVPHFEILIEDQHIEKSLGRPASSSVNISGTRVIPAHKSPSPTARRTSSLAHAGL